MFEYGSISNDDFLGCAKRLSTHIDLQELINIVEYHQQAKYPNKGKTIDLNRSLEWLSNACFGHSWNVVSVELKTLSEARNTPLTHEIKDSLLNVSTVGELAFSITESELVVMQERLHEKLTEDLRTTDGVKIDENDFLIGVSFAMCHLFGKRHGQSPRLFAKIMLPNAAMQVEVYYLVLTERDKYNAVIHTLCSTMNELEFSEWYDKNKEYPAENYEVYDKAACKMNFAWDVKNNEPVKLRRESVNNKLIKIS